MVTDRYLADFWMCMQVPCLWQTSCREVESPWDGSRHEGHSNTTGQVPSALLRNPFLDPNQGKVQTLLSQKERAIKPIQHTVPEDTNSTRLHCDQVLRFWDLGPYTDGFRRAGTHCLASAAAS